MKRVKTRTITKQQARDGILHQQLLSRPQPRKGKSGALQVIKQLGYIQIDTINVIDRSHHIVLYTRCPDHTHDHLHTLQARDRTIFEYWAHAASYVPMADYRYYLRKMKEEHIYEKWMSRWINAHRSILRKVRKRIEQEGPLAASDFADERNRKRGSWWDWKPAKAALEILFWKGDLMIAERRNFQRVYDLTERVLPARIDTTIPTHPEEEIFFITRALKAMALATIQDLKRYIHTKRDLKERLLEMWNTSSVRQVNIKGLDRTYFMLTSMYHSIKDEHPKPDDTVRFLSPFDNAIILRDRIKALFDFDYALECYTPWKKRKYGYFCLPILWQNNLIGRIDPKANRKNSVLQIKSIYLEKPVLINDAFFVSFVECLRSFAVFHRCDEISINKVFPRKYKREIMRLL